MYRKRSARDIVTSFDAMINKLMAFVISLAPIGVFIYMSWVVATQGAEILGSTALVLLCTGKLPGIAAGNAGPFRSGVSFCRMYYSIDFRDSAISIFRSLGFRARKITRVNTRVNTRA